MSHHVTLPLNNPEALFERFIENIAEVCKTAISGTMYGPDDIEAAQESARAYLQECRDSGKVPNIQHFIEQDRVAATQGQSFNDFSIGNDGYDSQLDGQYYIYLAAQQRTQKDAAQHTPPAEAARQL